MLRTKLGLLLAVCASHAFAQLTTEQKVSDFMQLAGLYAKNYAAYEWKRDVIGFDLYDVKPWLDRVKASKDDLDFYDICVRYVASLQDTHDEFFLPTDFYAALPFAVDIYDGKVLIDGINRTKLPAADYPFNAGDELVSVDGRKTADLIDTFVPYAANGSGNASTRKRLAASTITRRRQDFFPRAPEIGDSAVIVVRNASGTEATYTIPWIKSGTPFLHAGPVASPRSAVKAAALSMEEPHHASRSKIDAQMETSGNPNSWGAWMGELPAVRSETTPSYLQSLRRLQISGAIRPQGSTTFNSWLPKFGAPPGLRVRLGPGQLDEFITGTFPVGDKTAGFIRISNMHPYDIDAAIQQFATEITWFQANTDALVVDLMGNGGGDICYAEYLATYLIPKPFRGTSAKIRATQEWVHEFSQGLYAAVAAGAPKSVIDQYSNLLAQVQLAMNQERGMTAPLPLCGTTADLQPVTDKNGNPLAYNKPILLLVDDFTVSSAENLAMFLQQEGQATILGVRTAGGGGTADAYYAGTYGEGASRVTRSVIIRSKPVSTPGFPTTDYLENVGVYPDIIVDYMTRENLMNGGTKFVQQFSDAVAKLISTK